mgnify:CR=1 FL=1
MSSRHEAKPYRVPPVHREAPGRCSEASIAGEETRPAAHRITVDNMTRIEVQMCYVILITMPALDDNMEAGYKIKGMKEEEYPVLFAIIKNLMGIYNIKKIRVFIRPKFENACALSLFGNYLIIGKPFIENLDTDELEAVISHEFSHLFNRDSFSVLILSIIFCSPTVVFYLLIDPNSPSFLMITLFFLSLIFLIYGFKIRNWITFHHELRADREAVLRTRKPKALQSALIKITTQPLISPNRPSHFALFIESIYWLIAYFIGFEHPHLKERIEYLDFTNKILEYHEVNPEISQDDFIVLKACSSDGQ